MRYICGLLCIPVQSCALLVSARSLSNAVKKVPCDHRLGIRPLPLLPALMIHWYLMPFHQLPPSLYSS